MTTYLKECIRTGFFCIGSLLKNSKASRVVYYHDIHLQNKYTTMSTNFELFKKHINVIRKEGFSIVRDIDCEEKQVQLAFDDGFRGIWECAELLINEHLYPTIFIPVSLIGKKEYLTENEIIALHKAGFNIQSHGVRHSNMSAMSPKILLDDLVTSKQYLEALLGKNIDSICFPQGYFSDAVVSEALKAGYSKLYASYPDIFDMYNPLKGRLLFQSLSPQQAGLALHGGMDVLAKHYKKLHYNTSK